jgi:hypothetical protein
LWVALYYYSFLAAFMTAAAIPHREVTDTVSVPTHGGGCRSS